MGFMLGEHAAAGESVLHRLLQHSTKIGGVFDLGYHEASVLTNDSWLARAQGVPQHCLLLAFPRGLDDPKAVASVDPADRGVILLRVVRETSLPNQADLVHLRAEDTDRAITNHYRETEDASPGTDHLTRAMMQQAAFRCRILGTFVEDQSGDLVFGKDVDAVYAAAGYMVAKPYGDSLQLVVDHVELPMGERLEEQRGDDAPNADLPDTDTTMVIGTLRYSSARRRENIAKHDGKSTEVAVQVRPKDFVAHKTAVFGMTRAGKSNTMKVLASAVHLYSYKTGTRVGQLIFDPAGEYAYANRQDGTALSQLGDNVRIYRLGATSVERDRGIRPLSLNFFDPAQIDGSWGLISTFLAVDESKHYVRNFLSADPSRSPDDVEEYGDKRRLEAVRAMYFAILIKAGLQPGRGWNCRLPVNKETRAILQGITGLNTTVDGTYLYPNARQLVAACEVIAREAAVIAKAASSKRSSSSPAGNAEAVKLWFSDQNAGGSGDPAVDGLVNMLSPTGSASGWKILRPMNDYHSAEATTDFAPSIYADLARGRLVIVDLSRGSEQVLQTCAELVVREILGRASKRFRNGLPPRPMQIFLEEAHRLLHRDKFNKATDSSDPYVRLAKEAAKYKIGMIYATQEVSSVDAMILSNTANWVCAYMNNAAEADKLSKYYDFKDYADQILTADDRGFVRLRTDSSPYTLPVQVTKFDLAMVNSIRAQCGLGPTDPSEDFAPEQADDDDFADCPDPDAIYDNRFQPPAATLFEES
jgi:Helicase HerA, central domain